MRSDPFGIYSGMNSYIYAGQNPLIFYDPLGLFTWNDPATWPMFPEPVEAAAAGFGDGVSTILTLGIYTTADLREDLGIKGTFDPCSDTYQYAQYAGYAWGIGLGWAGGLNGGSNSVFWSGKNAAGKSAKELAKGLGKRLEDTPIGKVMDKLGKKFPKAIPGWAWDAASWTFANNAKGTAKAVLRNPRAKSVWNRVEKKVLKRKKIPVIKH